MRVLKKIPLPVIILIGFVFFLPFSFNWKKTRESKIYDCFLFFNELELLEVCLNEMAPYVDKFARFADKIIYVPLNQPLETDNPWIRERWQRQQNNKTYFEQIGFLDIL
jgi:hypothetical protein